MHYLITGHTGFKGAWLTLLLTSQGHQVSGISLDPLPGALYEVAKVSDFVLNDFRLDIRNFDKVRTAIMQISPDVVFHMAAQPLVRESYRDPRGTIETNVLGTLNVLEAVSVTPSVKAQVVVTTDKVYRNTNRLIGYAETDPLGGEDPYSASKAMADLLTHSWTTSFESPPTTVVRAGNVIGGGDVSKDRLIPDIIDFYSKGMIPTLRYPRSIRPWQHVLDCLSGYTMVANCLINGEIYDSLNIGPDPENIATVEDVTRIVAKNLAVKPIWHLSENVKLREADLLLLDSKIAKEKLNWENKLDLNESISWTTSWYKDIQKASPQEVTLEQIIRYSKV